MSEADVTFRKGFWKKLFTGVADAIGGAAGAVVAYATMIGTVAEAIVGGRAASASFFKAWDLFAELYKLNTSGNLNRLPVFLLNKCT